MELLLCKTIRKAISHLTDKMYPDKAIAKASNSDLLRMKWREEICSKHKQAAKRCLYPKTEIPWYS